MNGKLTENSPTEATYADINDEDWRILSPSPMGPFYAVAKDVANRYHLAPDSHVGAGTDRAALVESLDQWVTDWNAGKRPAAFVDATVAARRGPGTGLAWLLLAGLAWWALKDKKGRR